jgi:hypothetical protein
MAPPFPLGKANARKLTVDGGFYLRRAGRLGVGAPDGSPMATFYYRKHELSRKPPGGGYGTPIEAKKAAE